MLRERHESLILSDDDELDAELELPPVFKLEAALDVEIMLCTKVLPVGVDGCEVISFEIVKGLGGKLVASWDDEDEIDVVLLNGTVEIGGGLALEVAKSFVNWVIAGEKLGVESEFKFIVSWFVVVVLGFREKWI